MTFKQTFATLFAVAALLTTGCSDELPPGMAMPGGSHVAFGDGLAEAIDAAFAVDEQAELSSQLLVGAEWFDVRFTVRAKTGRYVQAYGIKTPYETFVKPVSPRLPVAIQGGAMVLRQVHFNRIPVAGDYPLEIWLIDDLGQESNRVRSHVTVQ
jgi:hypothetical protein